MALGWTPSAVPVMPQVQVWGWGRVLRLVGLLQRELLRQELEGWLGLLLLVALSPVGF